MSPSFTSMARPLSHPSGGAKLPSRCLPSPPTWHDVPFTTESRSVDRQRTTIDMEGIQVAEKISTGKFMKSLLS
ncbi:hypothetical protein SESBI_40064 [Sesbania bispinosa]|nr:hypothetical protein SESBI_40064 [Sesbania bispinosa]